MVISIAPTLLPLTRAPVLAAFSTIFVRGHKADLKADVLKRWPGGLVEFYGMTEGGGTFVLIALGMGARR